MRYETWDLIAKNQANGTYSDEMVIKIVLICTLSVHYRVHSKLMAWHAWLTLLTTIELHVE